MSRPMAVEPTPTTDCAHTRAADPVTSHEAADVVNVTEKQIQVLRAVRQLMECGVEEPYTAETVWPIADQINLLAHPRSRPLGGSTVRSRLKELCDAGLMQVADRAGVTTSGRRCARYRITDRGIEHLCETEGGRR